MLSLPKISKRMQVDTSSFTRIFTEYYMRFVRFACSYVKNKSVAEDLVMDSIMTFWKKKEDLLEDTNIPAYILTVLKNKCIDHLRHISAMNRVSEQCSSTQFWELNIRIKALESFDPNEVFKEEIIAIVNKTLASLPKNTRDIFMKNRYDNLSYKEIASMYDISVKGVEYHISKTLNALRLHLVDYLTISVIVFFLQ